MKQVFKSLVSFKIDKDIDLNTLEDKLKGLAFQPCQSQELESIGWGNIADEQTHLVIQNHVFISVKSQKKLLPASVITEYVKIKAEEIEEMQGYKVGRKQLKDIKEDVIVELTPKAFTVTKEDIIWFDLKNKRLCINTTSVSKVDQIIGLLAKTFEEFPISTLFTNLSTSAAMTGWLTSKIDIPENLSVESDCELKGSGDASPTIKYKSYNVFNDDVVKHIEEGKTCTQLSLSWADKVSFVLNEDFHLKQIKYLDIADTDTQDQEDLESSLFLEANNLSELLNVLINEGLDGLKNNE